MTGVRVFSRGVRFNQIGGLTSGSVPFADTNGFLTQDNAAFFWDQTNKGLIVGPVGGFSPTTSEISIHGDAATGFSCIVAAAGAGDFPQWSLDRGRGALGSMTAIQANDFIGSLNFQGAKSSSAFANAASIDAVAVETFSGSAGGAKIRFQVAKQTTQTKVVILQVSHDNTNGLIDLSGSNGTNIKTDTTTGTKVGTGTTQKIGFFNATPIVQPTDNGALTDNTGGTVVTTLAAINNALAGTSCGSVACNAGNVTAANVNTQLGAIRDAIAGLASKVNGLRTRFSAAAGGLGLMA